MRVLRFERRTSSLSGTRSNQLSYTRFGMAKTAASRKQDEAI
jgi:hypothetical protein